MLIFIKKCVVTLVISALLMFAMIMVLGLLTEGRNFMQRMKFESSFFPLDQIFAAFAISGIAVVFAAIPGLIFAKFRHQSLFAILFSLVIFSWTWYASHSIAMTFSLRLTILSMAYGLTAYFASVIANRLIKIE